MVAPLPSSRLQPSCLPRVYPGDPFDNIKVAVDADNVLHAMVQRGGRMDRIPACYRSPITRDQIEGALHIRKGDREDLATDLVYGQPSQVETSLPFSDGTIPIEDL